MRAVDEETLTIKPTANHQTYTFSVSGKIAKPPISILKPHFDVSRILETSKQQPQSQEGVIRGHMFLTFSRAFVAFIAQHIFIRSVLRLLELTHENQRTSFQSKLAALMSGLFHKKNLFDTSQESIVRSTWKRCSVIFAQGGAP
jgi:hypothetical protein